MHEICLVKMSSRSLFSLSIAMYLVQRQKRKLNRIISVYSLTTLQVTNYQILTALKAMANQGLAF